MKFISLHTDYIRFKPLKKALRSIDDLNEKEKSEVEVKNALAVLTAVEKSDVGIKDLVKKFVSEIEDVAKQVNVTNIVLYPYAHLSSNLAAPDFAMNVLVEAEKLLNKSKKKYKVSRAPFGYYKEFELKVKGHPLSELSREIKGDGSEKGKGKVAVEEDFDYKSALRSVGKSVLDRSKLKLTDHRIIGQEMDLYSFSETAPGSVFLHNNGLIIFNELVSYWREKQRQADYQEISTPLILDKKLWQISGHWNKYKDNIFLSDYEGREFAVKPMNCPGGMLVYRQKPKSYRDLPLRVAELGVVHRQELSGVLAGLFRVIKITQDDAHIFCTEKQLESEIEGIMNMIDEFYKKFNLPIDHVELSTRPEKRIGDDKIWDKAEKTLEKVLKKKKVKYKINKGDGAFYGPKIDFHVKDSLNRTWQLSTIQLDFAMPERFDLEYVDKDNKRKRPVMLHRVVYGSLERFMGVLIEHTNGRLPTWLAPIQCRVLNFTDRNTKAAEKILNELKKKIPQLRVDSDFESTTVPSKVKEAELMRVPYIIVIGDREEKENTIAVRVRGNKEIETMKFDDFVENVRKEIGERL